MIITASATRIMATGPFCPKGVVRFVAEMAAGGWLHSTFHSMIIFVQLSTQDKRCASPWVLILRFLLLLLGVLLLLLLLLLLVVPLLLLMLMLPYHVYDPVAVQHYNTLQYHRKM